MLISRPFFASLAILLGATAASAASSYRIAITNGSGMPISPAVIYTSSDRAALTQVGKAPTMGFTRLCQTGNPADRLAEVSMASTVVWSDKTSKLLMPGETLELTVPVGASTQSLHFEAMYGKSKDVCAVFSVGTRELMMTAPAMSVLWSGRDQAVATGSFGDPAVPMGADRNGACGMAAGAIDCLRALAAPTTGPARVRFFPGYLPSVLSFLEERYGAEQTQSLLIPGAGALNIQIFANAKRD